MSDESRFLLIGLWKFDWIHFRGEVSPALVVFSQLSVRGEGQQSDELQLRTQDVYCPLTCNASKPKSHPQPQHTAV